jgi:hypothetical protein
MPDLECEKCAVECNCGEECTCAPECKCEECHPKEEVEVPAAE